MPLPTQILLIYGYWLIFGWVLLEQLGAPLPAAPILLAAGALCTGGRLNFAIAFVAALVGALLADSAWFFMGRRYGTRVLQLLCRMSFNPTVCLQKTEGVFIRRRVMTLMVAKFVPGLATLASPVAGQSGMSYGRFLFLDGAGGVVWIGSMMLVGRLFGGLLRRSPHLWNRVGESSGFLLLVGIGGFFLLRLIRRRRLLRKLSASRMEPAELKRMLDSGGAVTIIDLRDASELADEPFTLPGALLLSPHEATVQARQIPRDRAVVVLCNCPNEASAASTALAMQRLGIEHVRPLRGGYDEWKRLEYPRDAVKRAAEPDQLSLTENESA